MRNKILTTGGCTLLYFKPGIKKDTCIKKIKYWLIAWLFVSHRVSDISAMCMTRASLRNNRACRKNDGNAMGIGFRLQEENKSNESCGRILSSTYSASIIRYTSLLDTSCARVCGRSSLFVWHGAIVWSGHLKIFTG